MIVDRNRNEKIKIILTIFYFALLSVIIYAVLRK